MHANRATDFYERAMMQACLKAGRTGTAVFKFFLRKFPAGRNLLMTARVEEALDYLENRSAPPRPLEWLCRSGRFSADFIDHLATLRFMGDAHAMPEGTVFFRDERIARLKAQAHRASPEDQGRPPSRLCANDISSSTLT